MEEVSGSPSSNIPMTPLLKEYEEFTRVLQNQIEFFKNEHLSLRSELKNVIDENNLLSEELKSLKHPDVVGTYSPRHRKDLDMVSNLQQRLLLTVQGSTGTINFPVQNNFENTQNLGLNISQEDEPVNTGHNERCPPSDANVRHPRAIEVKVEIQESQLRKSDRRDEQSDSIPNGNSIYENVEMETQMIESLEESIYSERDIASVGVTVKENTPNKHNGVSKTYSCEICVVSFKKKTAFISHMKLHMTDEIDEVLDGDSNYNGSSYPPIDQNPFLCSICGGSYKFKESFIAHIKLHDNKNNGAGSQDFPNLPMKTGDQSYSCAICHASFKIKQGFITHVRQYHGQEKSETGVFHSSLVIKTESPSFICAVCNASFDEKAEFTSHLLEHTMETDQELAGAESDASLHETDKEYTCAICEAVYKNRQGFVSHIRLHTVEKRFECSDCQKRFTSHSDLTRHYRCHTGEKPFCCMVCQKSFARQDHLAKHIRTHTGFKPYTCGECDFSFAEKKTLASHLRSHRGEKPYECPTCHKMFARQMNFTAHMRSHAGTKLYKCTYCDKGFLEKRGLSRHISAHHSHDEAGGS